MINKISGSSPINNLQSIKNTSVSQRTKYTSDEVSVSAEAKQLADEYLLNSVAEKTPDVRTELVEQMRLKIQDPNFFSEATIAATADQILSAYGF